MKKNEVVKYLKNTIQEKAKSMGINSPVEKVDYRITEGGVYDSIGFFGLITDIEAHYNIEIDFSELDPNQFTTIEGLSEIIMRLVDK